MCVERSRNWPDLSIRPGFSAPFSPYRTSFICYYSLGWMACLNCFMEQRAGKFNCPPANQGPLHDEFKGIESKGIALAPDMAGIEMPADHERRLIGKAREQLTPGHRRLHGVGIRGRRPVEMRHLAGVVGDVAAEQRLFALGLDQNAHMARTVAARR